MSRLRPFLLALLVMIAMSSVTWLVWDHERQNSAKELRSQFDFLLRETVSRVEQRMEAYEQMLHGVQVFFAATKVSERGNFREYVESLQLDANFSGIDSIGVIEWRPKDGDKTSAPITKIELSIAHNPTLSGVDQWPDHVRRLAMEKSRNTGLPTISSIIRVPGDAKGDTQPGFIMYLPIYARGEQHDSEVTRRANLTGWVFAIFNMHNLMASIYGVQLPGIALAMYDDVEPSAATLLYSSTSSAVTPRPFAIAANEYLVVAGHNWTLSMTTQNEFNTRFGRNATTLILIAGISLSFILGFLAWLLATGGARATRLATKMTSELNKQIHEYEVVQKRMLESEDELEETNRKLAALSITDGLTQIANRRRFDEVLSMEHARHARSGAELSLIMLDIDYFKAFNDTYGHLGGDDCLKQIAHVLAKCTTRPADLAARYGGEEFTCILPETDLAGSIAIAEKIRRGIIALAIPHSGSTVAEYVTASLGVATTECAVGESSSDILLKVDELLYRAKSSGRNRIAFVAQEDGALTSVRKINENLVHLLWKDSFCCDNQLIDSQHESLFKISNELLEAVLSSSQKSDISMIITRLLGDVSQHFKDEEVILESVGFPGIDQHKTEHAKLLAKGLDLSQQFEASTLSIGDVFQFLVYEVVMIHMLGADREYLPFIENVTITMPDMV